MRKNLGVYIAALALLLSAGGLWLLNEYEKNNPTTSIVEKDSEQNSPQQDPRSNAPELAIKTVVWNLNKPWDIDFLPGGDLLINERNGNMTRFSKNGTLVADISGLPDIYANGEGGLLGLAVDPEFSENNYVYVCYDTLDDIRVSRWVLSDNTLTDQVDIITGMPVNTDRFPGRHSGCRLEFDQKQVLWVGTGDVAQSVNPQDPQSLGGKILRVDRDGQPVTGNLSAPFDPRVHSYGHRNVQGLALSKGGESFAGYSVQHGPDRDDEVNLLVSGNFGWNPGPDYDESVPMTDLSKFPKAIESVWSSGKPTLAPSGATIIYGDEWGGYDGNLFVAMQKTQHLRMFETNDDGSLGNETELFKEEFGRLRTAQQGPDGALYILTDNGDGQDRIVRISPQ